LDVLKRLLHATAQWVLNRFGYQLAPYPSAPPIDLRAALTHPGSVRYHSEFHPALVDMEIRHGRGLRVVPLDCDAHPFVYALRAALRGDDPAASIATALGGYYDLTRPTTAAEWLDLTDAQSPALAREPPWAVTMPWDRRTPAQWRAENECYTRQENLAYQRPGESLTIESGWHFWGPVTAAKLQVETRRLTDLLSSLLANGFVRHDGQDGDVCAVLLIQDSDLRWQVLGGEHRAAACSALGHTVIPVRVLQVVSRGDVDLWPGVVRGDFSREAALMVFDSVFAGRLPKVTERWQQRLNCARSQ
jgi:hypothetical protein